MSCLSPITDYRDLELIIMACLLDRSSANMVGRGEKAESLSIHSIETRVCRTLFGTKVEFSEKSSKVIQDMIVGIALRYNDTGYITREGDSFNYVKKNSRRALKAKLRSDIGKLKVTLREWHRERGLRVL